MVELTVYSDVLCPWCYNGAVRLAKLREEFDGAISIAWKSFLLRPDPKARDLEKFREYTRSWSRPAGQADGGRFRPWSSDDPPPSHSVPPLVACKAAGRLGAFDRYQLALMDAYFHVNRDITNRRVIVEVAATQGLDVPAFGRHLDDRALADEVAAEHAEAVALGVTAVPTVVTPGGMMLPGAQDLVFYRRLVRKLCSM